MAKIFVSIIIYLVLIVLQFILPKYMPLNLWLFYPNFALMFVIYLALNKGVMKGQITGFVYGLTWDVLSTDIFGVRALSFTVAGYLAGNFNRKFNKNQPLTQIIVMGIGLIVTHFVINVVYMILPVSDTVYIPTFELSHLVILNILVNLILTPVIFKIFLFADNKIGQI